MPSPLLSAGRSRSAIMTLSLHLPYTSTTSVINYDGISTPEVVGFCRRVVSSSSKGDTWSIPVCDIRVTISVSHLVVSCAKTTTAHCVFSAQLYNMIVSASSLYCVQLAAWAKESVQSCDDSELWSVMQVFSYGLSAQSSVFLSTVVCTVMIVSALYCTVGRSMIKIDSTCSIPRDWCPVLFPRMLGRCQPPRKLNLLAQHATPVAIGVTAHAVIVRHRVTVNLHAVGLALDAGGDGVRRRCGSGDASVLHRIWGHTGRVSRP